jgi:hypothetical protein
MKSEDLLKNDFSVFFIVCLYRVTEYLPTYFYIPKMLSIVLRSRARAINDKVG